MADDKGAIERLAKKVDSYEELGEPKHSPVFFRGSRAPTKWKGASPRKPSRFTKMNAVELVFLGSLVFFIVAAAISALILFSGNNTVSTRNVDVLLTGPTEIGAGSTLTLQVVVSNGNAVPMELSDLIIEFPPGTRSDVDVSLDLPRIRESIGTIEPGESINRTVRAVVFGEAGKDLDIVASVEYRVPSSNAVFVSESEYTVKINQAPASIVIDALDEVVSGQQVTFSATVVSNAPEILENMVLLADYPPGFTFVSSTPTPSSGTAAWNLGDIEPGGERTITVRGSFTGEDQDVRVIHFTAGNKRDNRDDEIEAPLASADTTLTVAKPFISATLALSGKVEADSSIPRGKLIRGDIRWTNNLPIRVQDLEIELSFDGEILDRASVRPENGFYFSNQNRVLWSRETDPDMADVAPGASGVASFAFATLPLTRGTFKNPEIEIDVTVRARRVSETNVPESISSSINQKVLVATDLELVASLLRGVLPNSGPLPPRADKETTYSVQWTVKNSANSVANGAVTAIIPSYVRFTGVVSPQVESVTYNPVGGILTWNLGDVPAGTTRTVAFEIGITPSLAQIGTTPTLITEQRVFGYDRFIRRNVEGMSLPLSTQSGAFGNQGVVAP